jgi:hypothetical protein
MTSGEDEEHIMKRKGTTQHTQNHSILRILSRGTSSNAATCGSNNTATYASGNAAIRGSSLIWVISVMLIMIVVLGVGLTAVNGRLNLSTTRHEQHQAYYTALSSTDTLSAWITKGGEDVERLLGTIPGPADNPDNIVVNTDGLPAEVGTCEVNLRFLDPEKTVLKIASTATFAGTSETVSLTLTQNGSRLSFEGELRASDYSTTTADTRATVLANLESGGVVALYEPDSKVDNTNSNTADRDLLDRYITGTKSTAEARWTNVNLMASEGPDDNFILGTQHNKTNGAYDTAFDNRRFMMPKNGRITIDPLEQDVYAGTPNAATPNGNDNTKLVTLSIEGIDGVPDKEVLFRLASGSAATEYGLLNNTGGSFYDRSRPRWASLLMFNFTDNAGKTETLNYSINGDAKSYTWHPNTWKRLDIFVQPDAEVVSNLVIGPFGHKNDATMDLRSFGNFVDNWHGTQVKDFKNQWPYVESTLRDSQKGLPLFPVDYGKGVGFWILDGGGEGGDRYFRIMQGANIMSGTIYSTRPTIIGGALIRSSEGHTTDNLNSRIDGFADVSPVTFATYVEATTRYGLLVHNTDIILKAPSSGTAASEIRRPQTWRDRNNLPNSEGTAAEKLAHVTDTNYEPTMTIKGGTIYVGDRQTLTIKGATRNNMWVAPDKIVVAAGGALIIEQSAYTNVLTDIYVDGGALTINRGARIKGNIYAYNGATVDVKPDSAGVGNFWLASPKKTVEEQKRDGLFIYGKDTIGTKIGDVTIHSAARITVPENLVAINGTTLDGVLSDGSSPSKIHLVGGDWTDLVGGTDLEPSDAVFFLCDGYDKETGRCLHTPGHDNGSIGGDWAAGAYGSD